MDIGDNHIYVKAEAEPTPKIEKVKYLKTEEVGGVKLTRMVEEEALGSPDIPLAMEEGLEELDENLVKVSL